MMHTDQTTDIPEHLRQMSLGEETDSTSYEETGRNRNIIPQVDGTVDSRDSLDQTPDSIDLTKSPEKNTNTQRDIEKINEDTIDDDIDEMIEFNKDKVRTIYRKDINDQRKRVKIVKPKKDRTTKVYAINIERKRLLKQRREKVLQNVKDRKLVKANAPLALQASIRENRASKDTQDIKITDNATVGTNNTDNAAIDTNNTDNATTDGDNTDDATTSDNNTDNATTGDGKMDNAVTGEVSTVYVPLLPHYGGKAKHPSQIKTSSRHATAIAEPTTDDPLLDSQDTVKASGHTVDLSDVHIYEFLIQGTPNPCDLEGIEEDQLLEIQ